jgi:hypothetical protein
VGGGGYSGGTELYWMSNGITTVRCLATQKYAVLFNFMAEASNHVEVCYFTRFALNETIYVP